LFTNVDWKESSVEEDDDELLEPFPDLKISIVKEIVSTGGLVSAKEVITKGGQHLTPEEFHQVLVDAGSASGSKPVVLVDVRNTFEHDIGHFVHPTSGQAAMNPEMVTFSSFDSNFCAKYAAELKDKKVLMYCTGGIR
jgi:predicted sulfurtransferase